MCYDDLIPHDETKVVMCNPAPTQMYWKWIPGCVEPPGDTTSNSEDEDTLVASSVLNAQKRDMRNEPEQVSQAKKKSRSGDA